MLLIKRSRDETKPIAYQFDLNEENKIWFKHLGESGFKSTYCFTNRTSKQLTPLCLNPIKKMVTSS